MLMYGKMLKLAELGHFWADFGPLQNFQLNKHKKFLTSGEKDNSMQHHLGCKKWQKHGANFT